METQTKSKYHQALDFLSKSDDPDDKQLLKLVNEGSSRTRSALEQAGKENDKFTQYLTLQSTIAQRSEEYLSESRTTYEQFKDLLTRPTPTQFQRTFASLTKPLPKRLQYNPERKLDAEYVGNTILDLHTAQIRHKESVATSLNMLQNRRKIVYESAKDMAVKMRDSANAYQLHEDRLNHLIELSGILEQLISEDSEAGLMQLRHQLDLCTELKLLDDAFDSRGLIARIDGGDNISGDLYVVKQDIDLTKAKREDSLREAGLGVKGSDAVLKGLELNKDQFDQAVKAQSVQVQQSEIDLEYSKHIAKNSFVLAKANNISNLAADAFMVYKDMLNLVQVHNSLGTRIILDKVGFMLTNPILEPEVLEQAQDELNDGARIWAQNESRFHESVKGLLGKVGEHGEENLKEIEIDGGFLETKN